MADMPSESTPIDTHEHSSNEGVWWQKGPGNSIYPSNTSVGQTVTPAMRERDNQDRFNNTLEKMK